MNTNTHLGRRQCLCMGTRAWLPADSSIIRHIQHISREATVSQNMYTTPTAVANISVTHSFLVNATTSTLLYPQLDMPENKRVDRTITFTAIRLSRLTVAKADLYLMIQFACIMNRTQENYGSIVKNH